MTTRWPPVIVNRNQSTSPLPDARSVRHDPVGAGEAVAHVSPASCTYVAASETSEVAVTSRLRWPLSVQVVKRYRMLPIVVASGGVTVTTEPSMTVVVLGLAECSSPTDTATPGGVVET